MIRRAGVRTTPEGMSLTSRLSGSSVITEEAQPMTFEQCQRTLIMIRRQQGTRYPLVRVDCAGAVYRGRLARADSDPEFLQAASSPYGVLVLEPIGLNRSPETIVQIASIPEDGLNPIDAD